jgi:hypothetical protein
MMKPCKHLDHTNTYAETCELVELGGFSCDVKYWRRRQVPYQGASENVQFCGAGRGRINGIFPCYNPGELSCYEPANS